MELKQVNLILENCEVLEIDRKYIGYFHIGNIKTSINRNACNSISKDIVCEDFTIEINRSFKDEELMQYTFGDLSEKRNPIERLLRYPDITALEIVYQDDSKEYIYVDWQVEDGDTNKNQKNLINNFGDLYIVISENKGIEDFYNNEEINNEDIVDFSWSMYEE
ncbi:hypothetical protein [Lederbergia lenta]|uniref:hypothetical protein n=1 Tax=Lederbergia lenta TaxID=1467 RepID=UPI00203F5D75|nr:hypothetical protein [Lederbergia lenta]MCM3109886.1 hypothetical protein [Lederbergia lenta]